PSNTLPCVAYLPPHVSQLWPGSQEVAGYPRPSFAAVKQEGRAWHGSATSGQRDLRDTGTIRDKRARLLQRNSFAGSPGRDSRGHVEAGERLMLHAEGRGSSSSA